MDAVDRLPYSVAREQRAIDLRAESRLAYMSVGNIEQWLAIGRDGEARAEKIGDEGRRLASITIRAAAQQAPRLAWPYGVVSASFVLGAIFIFWPPKRQDGAVSR
jgi:hypothetical protein